MFTKRTHRFALAIATVVLVSRGVPALAEGRPIERASIDADPRLAINRTRDLTVDERRSVRRQLNRGTQEDALRVLGHPHSVDRFDAQRVRWWYKLGPGFLQIHFRNGRVVSVSNECQTGMREDDFVGIIRP
jgi:hypothetical protein